MAPVVSNRTTLCGARVFLHADGSVSDRRAYISRAKLPTAIMWRAWQDVGTYNHHELAEWIRNVRKQHSRQEKGK